MAIADLRASSAELNAVVRIHYIRVSVLTNRVDIMCTEIHTLVTLDAFVLVSDGVPILCHFSHLASLF